ncbi:MAG: ABC transporter permease subunit [Chloroflexi bacterium]|nr:ABC transporter permease subunit [Chloroflexota bacterium]
MRIILSVAYKELSTYVTSPMAYVVAGVFLALTGVFFINTVDQPFALASVRGLLGNTAFFLMPLIPPIMTMRLLAEEQKMGTLELLMTAPVRDYEIVIGKFLSSFIILAASIFLTLFYVFILRFYSDPDPGPILSGYLGILLYSASTLAIGLLASAFTGNQIVAATVGFGIILLFSVVSNVSGIVGGAAATILEHISLTSHYDAFTRGVIDTSDILYYLIMTTVFLFLTIRTLESRRWR